MTQQTIVRALLIAAALGILCCTAMAVTVSPDWTYTSQATVRSVSISGDGGLVA